MKPYSIAYQHASRHGIVAAIHLPTDPEPVPDAVWERLHPREIEAAQACAGLRRVSFVGGRLALRLAAQQLGVAPGPMLPDPLGAPTLPAGLVGSVSHKRALAVALVGRDFGATVGVDLEDYGPPRLGIAPRVLTPAELDAIAALDEERRWIALLLRFSLKEAVYKAISPWVRRYVGFHEAEVTPDTDGEAAIRLSLEGGEGPFHVEGTYAWLHGRLLTSVRLRPLPAAEGVEAPSLQR